MDHLRSFINRPFAHHLVLGTLIRLILIIYADIHDALFEVPYTDIDYKVFSDAAYNVLMSRSPYKRQTYRYSPLLAFMLVPNYYLGKNFGKLLFTSFDIMITVATKVLVRDQLATKKPNAAKIASYSSLFWLYNPLSIAISTRGNADSVSCFFVIMSLLFLQSDVVKGLQKYTWSGFFLGLAIHLRLYPLAFSLPMYLSLGGYIVNRDTKWLDFFKFIVPNKKQITLVFSCVTTLYVLMHIMYSLYGYDFLFESYLYHIFRKDCRHNFSVLFYHSYLTMDLKVYDYVKALTQICEIAVLYVFSFSFGLNPNTLPFCMFIQAMIMVSYNAVMTSQYFTWFISLLPLVVHNFEMKSNNALRLSIFWFGSQAGWLFFAYLLEFKGYEIFIYIWFMGIVLFGVNNFILSEVIKSFKPGYGFGYVDFAKIT